MLRRLILPGVGIPLGAHGGTGWALVGFHWGLITLLVVRRERILGVLVSGGWEEIVAATVLLLCLPWAILLGVASEKGSGPGTGFGRIRRTLRRNRGSAWGAWSLLLLCLAALTSPILAPYDPDLQPRDIMESRYLPPFSILHHLTLPDGSEVTAAELRHESGDILYRRQGEWRRVPGTPEGTIHRVGFHLLGTDGFGRDLFSRILFGARVSISIGFLAVLLAASLGTLIGGAAGFAGGMVETVLMRFVDVWLSLPRLFLILAVVGIFRPSILLIVLLLGCTGWMDTARLVRGQILALKDQEFIQAARAVGQRFPMILLRHLLPNTVAPILVDATLSIGNTILVEAALSYLGLGVQPPTASWGNLVSSGRDVLLDAWWISAFPGLAIVFTVVSLNLVGDGLRQAFDPRSVSGNGPRSSRRRDQPGGRGETPAAADGMRSGRKRMSAATETRPDWMRIS